MQLLASNFAPAFTKHPTYAKTWIDCFQKCDHIRIGVGYVSTESVLLLTSLVKKNPGRKLELCVGMAHSEGLSPSQHFALSSFDDFLRRESLGGVYIPYQFPFHGKIQTFALKEKIFAGLIGSSNLSNIIPIEGQSRGNYEVDALVSELDFVQEIDLLLSVLVNDASETFAEASPRIKVTIDENPMFANYSNVEVVSQDRLAAIQQKKVGEPIEIPVKTEQKSHLNAYFGKGRENKQGFIAPRHWYESEIILSSKVRNMFPDYSQMDSFIAYTDDGYRFQMSTHGDFNKNLRTSKDLTVLGRWFKGRMEMAGVLKAGQMVDDEVLKAYGRSSFSMTQTSLKELDSDSGRELAVWLMDFGIER